MEAAPRLARIRAAIPRGRELPPEVFRSRHRVILVLLWAHAIGIAVFGVARGHSALHTVAEASIVAVLTAGASYSKFGQRTRGTLAALGLVTSSALLVHFSSGAIEVHFHFFVVLGLLTLYQDWTPYGLAFLYVVLHHGVMGVVDPASVYNHLAAQRAPWLWAGIHGGFVAAACLVQLFSWRVNETEHARAEDFHRQVREAHLRRRQALEINDGIVQGLVVAQLATSVGQSERAQQAMSDALGDARRIISELLSEANGNGRNGSIEPGALIRNMPTTAEGVSG